MRDWRFHLAAFDGRGGNTIVCPDIALTGFAPAARLSGAGSTTASIPNAGLARLRSLGIRVTPYRHAIIVECDGVIRDVALVTDITLGFDAAQFSLAGLMSYFANQPYRADKSWINADPAALFRHIIAHVQAWRGCDLGVRPAAFNTAIRVGTKATTDGQGGPYRLSWYDCQDVSAKLTDLATLGDFDYWLTYAWNASRTGVAPTLALGPDSGRARADLRLISGETVVSEITPKASGADGYTDVWFSGSGEGAKMVFAVASDADPATLGRWKFVTDKNVQSKTLAQRRVDTLRDKGLVSPTITTFTMLDSTTNGSDSIQLGDRVHVYGGGRGEAGDFDGWLKITEIAWDIDGGLVKYTGA